VDTSAYYCFITISTIGFGDVVPRLTQPEDQYKLIAVCMYMLFGMATLSMCFTLAQDQMAAKFKLVKERCRMLSPCRRLKDEEEDSDEVDEAETESRAARAVPVQPVTTLTDALRHS